MTFPMSSRSSSPSPWDSDSLSLLLIYTSVWNEKQSAHCYCLLTSTSWCSSTLLQLASFLQLQAALLLEHALVALLFFPTFLRVGLYPLARVDTNFCFQSWKSSCKPANTWLFSQTALKILVSTSERENFRTAASTCWHIFITEWNFHELLSRERWQPLIQIFCHLTKKPHKIRDHNAMQKTMRKTIAHFNFQSHTSSQSQYQSNLMVNYWQVRMKYAR